MDTSVKESQKINENKILEKKSKKMHRPPVKTLLLPAIIFVAIMTQIPFILTIYYSLHEWNVMRPDRGIVFIGLSNFERILSEPTFWTVLSNTFWITTISLILCLLLGMSFALLMNREFFGKGIIRTMLVSPFFIMPIVSGIVWKTLVFNPNFGYSAYLAGLLGSRPLDFLAQYPLETIIIIVTWQWTPFFMLVLLAGLQSVPEELIEAAQIDGANKFQQFIYVLVPHLLRYIEVVIILGLIFILQIFGKIYVTTGGGPGHATTNLPFYVFRMAFQGWDIGAASAIGVITVFITVILMTILFMFMRKKFREELS